MTFLIDERELGAMIFCGGVRQQLAAVDDVEVGGRRDQSGSRHGEGELLLA